MKLRRYFAKWYVIGWFDENRRSGSTDLLTPHFLQDVNQTKVINYTEFLAATLETQGTIEEYRLSECFDQMDSDDSGEKHPLSPTLRVCSWFVSFASSHVVIGYISRANLRDLLGKHSSEAFIDKLMAEAATKKDGRISYEEFLQAVSKGHRESVAKIYDESEQQLSVVSEEDAEETRTTNEVLQRYGLLDSLKTSIGNLGTIRITK